MKSFLPVEKGCFRDNLFRCNWWHIQNNGKAVIYSRVCGWCKFLSEITELLMGFFQFCVQSCDFNNYLFHNKDLVWIQHGIGSKSIQIPVRQVIKLGKAWIWHQMILDGLIYVILMHFNTHFYKFNYLFIKNMKKFRTFWLINIC